MDLIRIYQCLCDRTRLRVLHLLTQGPLCVCHFQEILDEPQVKISKHLSYLKSRGIVAARREANWMIYSLPAAQTKQFKANLACLQDCATEEPIFRQDAARLQKLRAKFESNSPVCCAPARRREGSSRRSALQPRAR